MCVPSAANKSDAHVAHTLGDVLKIVLLHGVWSHGAALTLLKHHLEHEYGFDVRLFNYQFLQRSLDENARALADFIRDNELSDTHLVGHSLGGVVLLRMLANGMQSVSGRIVCLGSPLRGSRAARALEAKEWGDAVLGRSMATGVVENTASEWANDVCQQYDVGVVAGDAPYGVGQLIADFEGANDGTVAVAETHLAGQKDHIVLPTSHKGLVLTREPADQIAAFLKRGEFLREVL